MNKSPLKLKIQLQNMPHKVIRKVLVRGDIVLYDFHMVIQEAMGWWNSHLFEFSDKRVDAQIRVGIPSDYDEEFLDMGFSKLRDSEATFLKTAFLEENEAKPFWYVYDFGDDWQHRISFQKVSKKQLEDFDGTPVCIEAQGKCPPEDVGSSWGYSEFLEIVKDKEHPEYEEMRVWAGIEPDEIYDENTVDINEINQRLKKTFSPQ